LIVGRELQEFVVLFCERSMLLKQVEGQLESSLRTLEDAERSLE
jgi:hypothetical protein